MRPRTELTLALALVGVIGVIVAAAGASGARRGSGDPRRSTYLAGPAGARAYAEALQLLGVEVSRFRRRAADLSDVPAAGIVYVVLDPSAAVSALEAIRIRDFGSRGADLLLAGDRAEAAMRCYGFESVFSGADRAVLGTDTVRIGAVLARAGPAPTRRRGILDDGSEVPCPLMRSARIDTLLATRSGAAVAITLTPDSGGRVTLVSDGSLFSNRSLRSTAAGEFALALLAGRNADVLFDEYHHGYGPSGGMLAAVRSWSVRSPFGWALWQLAGVGLLAVLASAIRFGPVRPAIERRRRSPLEHVRALATALAAARGRDVAVGLIVRGLRRRLARVGDAPRADPDSWLDAISGQVRSRRAREGVATLRSLVRGPAGTGGVLRAALAVEDVWDDLKP